MKISKLPPLAAANIGGNETVPVVKGETTYRAALSDLGQPMVDAAQAAAAQAQGFALALEATTAGGWFPSLEAGAAAVAEGEGFFVNDGVNFYTGQKVNGVGVKMAAFNTLRATQQLVSEGLPILATGTESAVTGECQDYLNQAIEDCDRFGGGKIIFPGKGYDFQFGGDFATLGTFTYADGSTMPFPRGLVRLRSNLTIEGNGARLFLAPGYKDPGGLFYTGFWEDTGPVRNVTLRGLELDGQISAQTMTAYGADTPDGNWWQQGHAIAGGSLQGLTVEDCTIHHWMGHGIFGYSASDYGMVSDDFTIRHCDIYSNLQGGAQLGISRIRSLYNRWHGDYGLTAIGMNVEVGSASETALDIWSIGDLFVATDGLSSTLATVKSWNGFAGLASDSPEALAARIHMRRGLIFTGDSYTGTPFAQQRGRIHVVSPTLLQATLGSNGNDWIEVTGAIQKMTYEDPSRIWPPLGTPMFFSPSSNYSDVYSQLTVTGAQLTNDVAGPQMLVHGYRNVSLDVSIEGGRGAGVRLEACGGDVRVRARNLGLPTDLAYWQALYPGDTDAQNTAQIGSTSAAVVVYTAIGPLDITVNAVDDRGAGAQLQYGAYLNVGTDFPVQVRGSSTGHLLGAVKDVNASVAANWVIDGATRALTIDRKLTLTAGLEVHGESDFISDAGDLNVNFRSPTGTTRKLTFFDGATARAQVASLTTGYTNFNVWSADGATIYTPIQLKPDGTAGVNTGSTS